jgi:hypothetical protein
MFCSDASISLRILYECLVMPIGLCNTLATFMHLMHNMLCPYIDSFVIDDILIFNNSWQAHISNAT